MVKVYFYSRAVVRGAQKKINVSRKAGRLRIIPTTWRTRRVASRWIYIYILGIHYYYVRYDTHIIIYNIHV